MIDRFLNLIKGWISKYIYELEVANPAIVYDNAIEQIINSYKLLKQKAAIVVRRADELEAQTKETRKQYTKVSDLLEAAAYLPDDEVDVDAAAEMIKTKDELKEKLDGLIEMLATAQADEVELTEALHELESEKRKLIAEKDTQIGKFESAKVRMSVMERKDGTSIDAIDKSLEGVRTNIKNVIAEANLTKTMQENTLENKVKSFSKATEGQSAKAKFQAMREAARQKSEGAKVLDEVLSTKPETVQVVKSESKSA